MRLDGWKEREQRGSQQFGIALEEAIRVYHQIDLPEALAHFLEAFIKKLSFSSHGWPPPELQEVAAR